MDIFTDTSLPVNGDTDKLVDTIRNTINYYKDRAEKATERANLRENEIRSKIENQYEAENKNLRNKMRYCVAMLGSDNELNAYKKFCEDHRHLHTPPLKIDGSKIPYIKQHGVGIGIITTVHCDICGAYEDITDMSIW